MLDAVYIGLIENVWPPDHANNANKYQYEYSVTINLPNGATSTISNCVVADTFGGQDDFEDMILKVGNIVLVMFPRDEMKIGIITGAIRNYKQKHDESRKVHWRKRFNKFEMGIDKDYNWSATSDFGPNAHVKVDKIILDDSQGQRITLDKNTKTITVEAELWTIDIRKDVNMTVGGNVTAVVKGDVTATVEGNLSATVKKDANLTVEKNLIATVKKDATVKVEGNLKAKVTGTAKVDANEIQLNGTGGTVLTDTLNPYVDMISGVPSIGVKNVKSG